MSRSGRTVLHSDGPAIRASEAHNPQAAGASPRLALTVWISVATKKHATIATDTPAADLHDVLPVALFELDLTITALWVPESRLTVLTCYFMPSGVPEVGLSS
jgi:hypothetical protein